MPRLFISTQNPVFKRLLAEAAAHWPGWEVTQTERTADCRVTDDMTISAASTLTLTPPLAPIRLEELKRLLEKQAAAISTKPLELTAGILFHPLLRNITSDAQPTIELTEKESELLKLLYTQKEMAREDILKTIWGYAETVDTRTLESHIHRLRAKLKALPEMAECLTTTATGYGFRELED